MREAYEHLRADHPFIVKLLDFGQYEGSCFLVMELIEGETVAQQLKKGLSFTSKRLAKLGADIADALAYLHNRGVIHRDIKPGNLIVDNDRNTHILDFGLIRRLGDDTANEALSCTPFYAAPEVIEERKLGPRSDVYSLGITLYEAATGKKPFEGNSVLEILNSQLRHSPAPLRQLAPDIDIELADLIEECIEKSPEKRPSAHDLKERLNGFLGLQPAHNGQNRHATRRIIIKPAPDA